MDNRPGGREKHITGQGKRVQKRGNGVGGGPVGRSDGYSGRQSSNNNTGSRAGGGQSSPLGIIIALIIMLSGGGGIGLNSLFGDDSSNEGTGAMQSMTSLLGSTLANTMFDGGGSVSTGWSTSSNNGQLDDSVAVGSRDKYTEILGDKDDTVTIMLYMCGTDLESRSGMATSDLQEIANADLSKNVNVLVYTGGCKAWKNNVISNRSNQIYKIENGSLRCLVKDDGNAPMTRPSTLTKYIKYCKNNYPANRYELILWDHGGGSISGYGYDEKNASSGSMTLKGINEALSAADTKFDFIGFDACLMATLENALMLDKHADYLIASEETEPGVGWYYTNWLSKLSKNTSMPTVEIGKNIVDDFINVCSKKCAGQKTTLSVIDLAELSNTVPDKLKAFSRSTTKLLQNNNFSSVSKARSNTREFAVSSKIDQVDLVHLAYNIDTPESKALASSLLGAIKYNKTSSNMTNSYGVSIYFPYRKASNVNNAVSAYSAIGVDSEYSRCIQQFASLEVSGQAVSGGASSPMTSILGDFTGNSSVSLDSITNILTGLMNGNFAGVEGLTYSNSSFLGKGLDIKDTAAYIAGHRFDPSQLIWTSNNGTNILELDEEQWSMVHDLQLNVFLDDGEGYIDLGLDNVYDFTDDGALLGEYDGTWLAIDDQPVAYYYMDSVYDGDNYTITGRVPIMLNGNRANLILVFDNKHPYGYIAGARADYINGETATIAKSITNLQEGDEIEFVCDYYTYDGKYQNSYLIGEPMTYTGDHEISNVYVDGSTIASYMFTDIYDQEYWTPQIP